jgi:hypothetical protein
LRPAFLPRTSARFPGLHHNSPSRLQQTPGLCRQLRVNRVTTPCDTAGHSPKVDFRRLPSVGSFRKTCLGIVLDMGAQLGDRSEPHRTMRELRLDRAVGIQRVGHAVDYAGF